MPDWAWFVLIPAFSILVVYALIRRGKLKAQLNAELTALHGAANILVLDDGVIYYGLRSKGTIQPSELGAALAVTAEWIHVRTWDYGKRVGFELRLPVDRLHRYHKTTKFPSLGPGTRILGGLLVLGYTDPETSEPEELALRLSQEPAVIQALLTATGKPPEES